MTCCTHRAILESSAFRGARAREREREESCALNSPRGSMPPTPPRHGRDPRVDDVRGPMDRPAVLVGGSAPYAIVDANDAWLSACSYGSRDQVVGQTLSIIQGPKTEPEIVAELMEGVVARVPVIELVLTNYDARRRPFRNELTVEPVDVGGDPYFLATCTITLHSRRGRLITVRRSKPVAAPAIAPPRRGGGADERAQPLLPPPDVISVPVTFERDFTADFTRLLSIPSLVEQILFSLDAPWAAQASQTCREWHQALAGPHAQHYWQQQCGRYWAVPMHALRPAEGMSDADWRWIFGQAQQHSTAPRPTTEQPLLLENPHHGTPTLRAPSCPTELLG